MVAVTTTNIDGHQVVEEFEQAEDGLFTAAGADTFLSGTILARDSVTLKFVPFVKGGATNENGIPKAILTYEVVTAGAGDTQIRALVAGQVRNKFLVIHADGDNTNVDAAVRDQLRDYDINVSVTSDLN